LKDEHLEELGNLWEETREICAMVAYLALLYDVQNRFCPTTSVITAYYKAAYDQAIEDTMTTAEEQTHISSKRKTFFDVSGSRSTYLEHPCRKL
jgi:hypothetical protein